jgi:hypothetical protein
MEEINKLMGKFYFIFFYDASKTFMIKEAFKELQMVEINSIFDFTQFILLQ